MGGDVWWQVRPEVTLHHKLYGQLLSTHYNLHLGAHTLFSKRQGLLPSKLTSVEVQWG